MARAAALRDQLYTRHDFASLHSAFEPRAACFIYDDWVHRLGHSIFACILGPMLVAVSVLPPRAAWKTHQICDLSHTATPPFGPDLLVPRVLHPCSTSSMGLKTEKICNLRPSITLDSAVPLVCTDISPLRAALKTDEICYLCPSITPDSAVPLVLYRHFTSSRGLED